uniref:Uncharacterized protein n=1 Tax=Sciurus vulgaris TaxID=55149 RepID=A0A8D2B7Y1_SCIVU
FELRLVTTNPKQSSPSASQVTGTTGMCHCTWLLAEFLKEVMPRHVRHCFRYYLVKTKSCKGCCL